MVENHLVVNSYIGNDCGDFWWSRGFVAEDDVDESDHIADIYFAVVVHVTHKACTIAQLEVGTAGADGHIVVGMMEYVVCAEVELAIVSLVAEADRIVIACEAHGSVLAGETAWRVSHDGHSFEHRVLDDFFCICPLDDVWLALSLPKLPIPVTFSNRCLCILH